MNIFFCDIRGTYSGDNFEREKSLKNFAKNLDDLVEADELDNLYFSFISTNHMNDVIDCVNELKDFLIYKKVKLGPQFSSNHILIDGEKRKFSSNKLDQMMQFLNENKVERIYYADDSLVNHKLFEHVMCKVHPEIQIQSFVLGTLKVTETAIGIEEKEINGLNKLLKMYIDARIKFDNSQAGKKIL